MGEEAQKKGFGVVIDRVVLKPGETRDLGDVRARMTKPGGGSVGRPGGTPGPPGIFADRSCGPPAAGPQYTGETANHGGERHGHRPTRHRLAADLTASSARGPWRACSDARLLERYVAHRDELAFEALVRRHGPMVLGVCRRVLDDPNDADDAFQAAFLLLAREGRSIRVDGSVGGWLHRVAWRIALQVKSDAARRRDQERRAAERAGEPIASGPARDDTAAVIHQEIDRLPDRYRRPVVLCYLEDMTYQQAADQLRWSEATTRGRLARARDLLRARLTRRGVTLAGTGLILAGGATPGTASVVPAALLQATVRAARYIGLGETAAAVSRRRRSS